MQFSPFRTLLVFVVCLIGIVFALPNLLPRDVYTGLPDWVPSQQVTLGLDLQGGSHLLLQVNRESIIEERVTTLRRDARAVLVQNQIGNIITTGVDSITIELTDPEQAEPAMRALEGLQNLLTSALFAGSGVNELGYATTPDGRIVVSLTPEGVNERMSALVAQSIEVIRNRVDELGTTEPLIQRQGHDRVLVQVPGFEDSARLKDIISRTARLTFHLVHTSMSAAQAEAQGAPIGYMLMPSADGGMELISEDVALGGESLMDAQPSFDQQTQQPVVTFRFDTRGAIVFGDLTSRNVGNRFAIVLDHQVITAPVVQQPITGGSGQISGTFTPQSANDLAVLLRAGALPATLDIIEERTVGPSLGQDSIDAGMLAGIIAGIAVVTFMIVAYGLFGVFANIALLVNVSLVFGVLSMLGATLTLPGIAGIVLTLGMAVDSNVLIYERIREEIASGRSVVSGIEAGFQRAMSAIMDANVTTLIAAVVLFFLGSGPVQGFAVTLAVGVMTTLFTAYLVTLFIIGRWYRVFRPKTVQIQFLRIIPDGTKIPFMKWRKIAIAFSVATSIISLGWFFVNGLQLGIDFRGGSAIEVQYTAGPVADPGHARGLLSPLGLGDVQVQNFGTPEDLLVRIQTQPGGDQVQQQVVAQVSQVLTEAEYEIRRTETVGPTVSGELALSGAIGLTIALLAVLVYIWFRFEWQFAVGAIVTTAHDIVLTIGFFTFTGFEFNASSIAAILTIIGYSLNDTVVIYDRIREYRLKFKRMDMPELIDVAINSTLPRTILTGMTTFFALVALVYFGGEVIRSFTTAMAFGVIAGTYSSIFIAAPILLYLGLKSRADVAAAEAAPKRADGAAI